jgi:hypothetical protein
MAVDDGIVSELVQLYRCTATDFCGNLFTHNFSTARAGSGKFAMDLFNYLLPPLSPNGQNSWLQIQRSEVRFHELSDFLRNSGFGMGSTQLHEDK